MLTIHDREETYFDVSGRFRALRFRVEGTPPPEAIRAEASMPRVRVQLERSRLWARFDPHTGHDYDVVWPSGPLPTLAVVPPITAAEVRAAPSEVDARWWAHWAHWMVDALCASERSPLEEGAWSVARMEPVDHRPRYLDVGEERGRSEDSLGGLFVGLAERDESRTKLWRKRARSHPVPPGLSWVLDGGGDLDVVLDGHCRLFGPSRSFLRLRRRDRIDGGEPLDVATWDHEVCRELERRGEDPAWLFARP
ncbi:MAG: hypothetical protein H6722_26600 [Sandaracinus sp.]|nr:hypothetical protein [Sandaracinus sp.]